MALIHRVGDNRLALGLVDQLTETNLTANLSEITRCYDLEFQKPAFQNTTGQRIAACGRHEEVLFVSRAQIPWPEVLKAYTAQVTKRGSVLMPVPPQAYDPVFCTWTAIHHDVSHDWIMRNAQLAAELGFRTWITDDGWFIEKGEFGDYRYAGDWLPETSKFPDLKAHVEAVQALGFRYVLWVAPFMVGDDSHAAQQHAHLLMEGQPRNRFSNLAPWYPETADIVADLMARLVQDYRLDGLKIDFLDSLRVKAESSNGSGDATLGGSFHDVLQRATDQVLTIQPELLIEYRNSYANLASRQYANIYRSSDVPINFTLNRWQAVMLRLLAPDRAVHMDPALWHPQDSDENVAVHMINCIASVPMVSIDLAQYPPSHLQIIRHWINFYNEHRETIIHGEFKPQLHYGHVPLICFQSASEQIISLYDDIPVQLGLDAGTTWLLNASTRPYVSVPDSVTNTTCRAVFRDKFGQVTAEKTLEGPVSTLNVEIGGSVELWSQHQG
jgi:alpha-galactosidase